MQDRLIPAFRKDMTQLINNTNNTNAQALLKIHLRRDEYSYRKEKQYITNIDRELGDNQHWRDIKAAYF